VPPTWIYLQTVKKYTQPGIIYELQKNILFSGSMHGGQRQLQHNRLVQLRENRKQERRMYWKDLIKIEIATILSIAWFIQMELL